MSKYIGSRIVPKHCGYWNSGSTYEVLSVVLYAATGDSYIARKAVPSGVDITDTEYWALCADFSAQLNTISNTVTDISSKVSALSAQVAENVTASTDADADYAAEVVDARIGTDGTVYGSAGEAIREQFNTVNDAVFEEGQNSYYNTGNVKTGTTIYYALAFTEKAFLYSLTPEFSGGDTFKWWIATCARDIVGNSITSISSIGDVNTASVGDTIIINQTLDTNQAIVIAPDDNTNYPMKYCGSSGTAELTSAVICNANSGAVGNSVSQVSNCYFGGTFVLVENTERYTTPEDVNEQIDEKLADYVSQESLDEQFGDPSEYVKEDDIYDIAYDTYTNESDRSASGYSYALFFTEEVNLYSFKPVFVNSEGTYTWQLVECDADVCDATSSNRANITSYLTDAETVNVGEAFIVNQTLTTKMAIIITGNSTSGYQRFLTSEDNGTCELSTVNIAQIASAGLYTISGTYRSSGTFVIVGKAPVYTTMEEVEEKLEDYVSKEELEEFLPDGCVTDEELEDALYETNDTAFDVTVSGSSSTSASLYYAIIFRKSMHLTSFTPVFKSGENTFTWCLFQTADGSEFDSSDTTATKRTLVALTDVTEQDMGTSIELDMDVDATMGLMIYGAYDEDEGISDPILYARSSGMEEYFGLAQVNAKSPTAISNPFYATVPGYAYSGEYIFTVPVTESKYLPRSETEEQVTAIVEELLTAALEEAKESANESNPLYGKKLVAIGDSMCRGQSLALANVWPALIAARNNMTYVNYGTNGDTISEQFDTETYPNNNICIRYADMDDDADYIIVYAGTNDASRSITPGDEDSTDTTEFYGALNVLMQGLISKYPKGKIGFITPTMSATASTTAKRMTYSDYIRTAAYNNGGIPVFDNITNAGVDYSNTEQYEALCMDSIHLNAEGQKHVSWKYEAFIRSL